MILTNLLKKILFLTAIFAVFFVATKTNAAGMSVGYNALNLNPGENIYYGVTSPTNTNGNFLLFEKGYGNTVFKIDYAGNITTNGVLSGSNSYWNASGNNLFASSTFNVGIGTSDAGAYKLNVLGDTNVTGILTANSFNGTYNGTINSPNVSSGAFAANTGGGNFSFPGYVGIGTTAPHSLLEVSSNTNAELTLNRQGNWAASPAGIKFSVNNAVTDYWTLGMQANSTNNFYLNRNSANYLTILDSTGNVGIGTTDPGTYKLFVNGDTNINGTLSATSFSGTYAGTINSANVSSGAFASNTGGGNFSFPGSLGVGTTNPGAYKLNVTGGDIYGSGNAVLAGTTGLTLSGAGADLLFTGTGPNIISTASGNNLALMPGGTGNTGVGISTPRGKLDIGGFYTTNYLATSTSWVGVPVDSFLPLGTFNANSNVKVVVNLSGCAFGDSALEYMVNKGYNGVPRIYYMGPSSYGTAPKGLDGSISFQYEIISSTSYYLGVSVTGGCNDSARTVGATMNVVGGANFTAVDPVKTNYTALIDYPYLYNGFEGNVGIGTADPGVYRLNVNGNTNINGVLTATSFSGTYSGTINSANVSAGAFASSTGGGNFSFPGSLGIGTTNPVANLEIRGSRAATKDKLLLLSKFDYGSTSFYQNYSNNFYATGKSLEIEVEALPLLQLAVNNSGTVGEVIFPNGNIGIGTSNPKSKVELYGTGQLVSNLTDAGVRTDILSLNTTSSSAGAGSAITFGNAQSLAANSLGMAAIKAYLTNGGGNTQGDLTFSTRNNIADTFLTENVRILSNGNVGIGTSTPGAYKLFVNGNTNINGTITATSFSGAYSGTVSAPNVSSGSFGANTGGGNFGFPADISAVGNLNITGYINSTVGYRQGGAATSGNYLRGNGTNFVSSAISAGDVPTLNQNTTGSAYYLNIRDTRAVSDLPQDFGSLAKFDFKANSTNGLSDGGTYNGVMTLRKYGSGSDFSGGPAVQLAYTDNGNLWTRLSTNATTWGTWLQQLNSNTGVVLQATTPGVAQTGNLNISGTVKAGSFSGAYAGTIGAPNVSSGAFASSTGGGNFSFPGNVGIGTTNPTGRLEINGSSVTVPAIRLAPNSTYGWNFYERNDNGDLDIKAENNSIETGVLYLKRSNGNVGIGTTNPAGRLNISETTGTVNGAAQGSLIIDHSDTGGASSIVFRSASNRGSDYGFLQYQDASIVGGAGESARLTIGTSNDTDDHLILMPTGNVGIGTTDPGLSYKLYVNGNTNINGTITAGTFSGPLSGTLNAGNVTSGQFAANSGGGNFSFAATVPGNIGIGTTTPQVKLDVKGKLQVDTSGTYTNYSWAGGALQTNSIEILDRVNGSPSDGIYPTLTFHDYGNGGAQFSMEGLTSTLHLGSGQSNSAGTLAAAGGYFSKLKIWGALETTGLTTLGGGAAINGNLVMTGGNITGINKISVNTVDPLYSIHGTNYASFAASVVGGVKEEITGKINIDQKVGEEYQATLNFDEEKVGTDLWVWHNVIEFNKDNVEALLTPYGGFANTYYYISGNSLIFKSDRPIEISYRLIAKRFDWRSWPTLPTDQTEKAGLIIK